MSKIVVLAVIVLVVAGLAIYLRRSPPKRSAPPRDVVQEEIDRTLSELNEIEAKISESLTTGPYNHDLSGKHCFHQPLPKSILPLISPGADELPADTFQPIYRSISQGTYNMIGVWWGDWYIYSYGPDRVPDTQSDRVIGTCREKRDLTQIVRELTYDPTNGSLSNGDIVVWGTVSLKNQSLSHSNQ